ncbi:unnamed protein product, partial [marine sediment metagenome]
RSLRKPAKTGNLKMKAVVLNKTSPIEEKPLELTDLPRPTVADDQILVKVSVCGACHTDL